MTQTLQLTNGLPVMTSGLYSQSIYYASGLTANTTITLPSSGYFLDANAKDILITVNDRVVEFSPDSSSRDFIVLGSGPQYTQIQFLYALSNDTVVAFRKYL